MSTRGRAHEEAREALWKGDKVQALPWWRRLVTSVPWPRLRRREIRDLVGRMVHEYDALSLAYDLLRAADAKREERSE